MYNVSVTKLECLLLAAFFLEIKYGILAAAFFGGGYCLLLILQF
jgi:hypothetical protein